jgi:hypothetical protein
MLFEQASAADMTPPALPLPPPLPSGHMDGKGIGGGTALLISLLVSGGLGGAVLYMATNPAEPPGVMAMQTELRQLRADETAIKVAQAALDRKLASAAPSAAPSNGPAIDSDALQKQMAPLNDQIAKFSARLDALESRPEPTASTGSGVSDITLSRLSEKFDGEIAQLRQEFGGKIDSALAAQNTALAQLQGQTQNMGSYADRLTKLEQVAATTSDLTSKAVKLARLQLAAVALATGQKLGKIDGAPAALAVYADQAPPTDAALRQNFAQYESAARSASRPELGFAGVWDRAVARMQQVVTVRKGDEVLIGDPAAGILARAADAVARDDLQASLAAADDLQGPAAAALKPWSDQVRSLLAARAALTAMMAAN